MMLTGLRPLAVQKRAPTPEEVQVIEGAILGPPGPWGIPPQDDLLDQLRVYSRSALVYRCASIWAEETIQVPLRIFEQKGRKLGAEVLDGPVWDLLGEINGFQAWPEFLYVTMLNLALAGNAFWWKVRNSRGVPVELWSLKPTEIRTERVGNTAALQYRWFPTEIGHPTAGYLFDQASIVHLRLPSPLSDVWGMAPVKAASDDIRADQQAKRSTLGMMDNSALPAGILSSQQDIGEEQAAMIRRQWREVYGGPANAGRIAVLGRGADFKPIAVQPKDIEYMNQRKYSRSGILAAFGVPPIYMGVESENFGNRREQRRQLWQDKLVPLFRLIEGQISERLLRDFNPSYVAILDESRTDVFVEIIGGQMDTADKATRARLMTPNEARRVFIQPFLRDVQDDVIGGDDFLVPLNMVPSKYINSGETLGWAEARIEQRSPGAPKAPETPAQAQAIAQGPPPPDITGKRADVTKYSEDQPRVAAGSPGGGQFGGGGGSGGEHDFHGNQWQAGSSQALMSASGNQTATHDELHRFQAASNVGNAGYATPPNASDMLRHALDHGGFSRQDAMRVYAVYRDHYQNKTAKSLGEQVWKAATAGHDPIVSALALDTRRIYLTVAQDLSDKIATAPPTDATLDHHLPTQHELRLMVAGVLAPHVQAAYTAGMETGLRQVGSQVTKYSEDQPRVAAGSPGGGQFGGGGSGSTVTDQAEVQRIKNSIAEGQMTLRSGTFNGRRLSTPELLAVRRQVETDLAKIGQSRLAGKPGPSNFTITDVTPSGYGPSSKALGDPIDPNSMDFSIPPIFDPQVAEFVRSQVALYAPLIGQDIVDAFREQLAEGLSMGEDITTLQNRLMQFADLQAPARALRVARTEIADAQGAGQMAAYNQNAQVERKKWVTSHDSHVRPAGSRGGPVYDHVKADGQIVAKDQPFIVSGERMMYPGDRSMGASPGNYINDRCAMVPMVAGLG